MKTLLFYLLFFCTVQANAQSTKEQVPIHYPVQQLLGVEYEIKDVSQPDIDRLLLIPYVELSAQRLKETDLEVFDPSSNYTIVLYSDDKCQQNKQ